MLNMFRMLIHPSSGACDLFVELFHGSLFNAQHVSDVNTPILRSLWLICWVISWVVLLWYDVCWYYVVLWLGWCGIRMQAEALLQCFSLHTDTTQPQPNHTGLFRLGIVPLFQTAINHQPPITTWKGQLCFSLQPGHYSSLTAPNLQHTANQGMYNFRFTILMNTNKTSNHQSISETHYTQENTTITTHKGSQLLILTETHYQCNQATKNFTPHSTKNHNFTLTLTPPSLLNETTNVVINITVASSWWWA